MMDVMLAAFDPIYGEAWNEQQLLSALMIPGTRYAIIDASGVIGPPTAAVETAGFYLTRQICDEEELLLIAVAPEYRRIGLASRLLRHLFSAATDRGTTRLFLEMRDDNPARHFYDSFGFHQVGLRKAYYRGADGNLRNALTLSASVGKTM
ncbi:GNAT family N-acetyltransferase [Croceicoccus bisphenolivorans]|uniref:GNAT family N-acetyltransferase n=1 Tax=Croceicoccus bisphenolivorans TaxID=1783232 RepID=UPI000836AF54|nr:GNAT family N-acetyltransferase [Croceicoccus bisphenolivorans]